MKKVVLILTVGMVLTVFWGYVFAWGFDDSGSSSWYGNSGSSWYHNSWNSKTDNFDRSYDIPPIDPAHPDIPSWKKWPQDRSNEYPNPERQLRYESCMQRCNRVPVQDAIDCMEACNAMFGPTP